MWSHIDSDAAYLVIPQARSRIVVYYHLSHHPKNTCSPKLNGPILIEYMTIKHVVASAAGAEIGGLNHNLQKIIPIRFILNALGHPVAPHMTSHIRHNTIHGLLHSAENILYTMAPYNGIHYCTVGYIIFSENHRFLHHLNCRLII